MSEDMPADRQHDRNGVSEKLIERPAATPDHHSKLAGRAISSAPSLHTIS
jgi:hypothetical protein